MTLHGYCSGGPKCLVEKEVKSACQPVCSIRPEDPTITLSPPPHSLFLPLSSSSSSSTTSTSTSPSTSPSPSPLLSSFIPHLVFHPSVLPTFFLLSTLSVVFISLSNPPFIPIPPPISLRSSISSGFPRSSFPSLPSCLSFTHHDPCSRASSLSNRLSEQADGNGGRGLTDRSLVLFWDHGPPAPEFRCDTRAVSI